ncbi:hypothetical protein [Desulfobacter postgatei]|uniref:hypothetical protein n=1 Tax=Desulfobacter postgatei TaxID=2293 RepID=UPI000232AA8B|nr:hypothetical protein [Desulfobacter postgatei]
MGFANRLPRNIASPSGKDLCAPESSPFYQAFAQGFADFYRKVINMGFTIANACYPMSMADSENKGDLNAVYAAASADRVVCFTGTEKALLFKALSDTIPRFRSQIRIFSPLAGLHTVHKVYSGEKTDTPYGCRGGIDFFYVNCTDGNTYPCGYRGADNLGAFPDLNINAINPTGYCLACDWECFRDPTELGGPLMEAFCAPWHLAARMAKDPEYGACWLKDLQYYKACDFFNGRRPPRPTALEKF